MKTSAPGKSGSGGWSGKILQVDLTSAKIWEEELSEELKSGYTGGAGINARLLYEMVRANPQVDPLSPDNPLIFGFGVLVGTAFPCSSRMTITAKSPLTRIFGDANGGGTFPARVKQAGYDHLVFKGKAQKPVALLIEKGKKPQLVDATDLWGLDTYATDEKIHEKYGECETARIGPAGENLVRYANICNSTKRVGFNGRAGMGCVMGSKNLKAIIVKADGTVPVADEKKFDELVKRYRDIWGKGPALFAHKEYGSLMLIAQNSDQTRVKNQQVRITQEQLDSYDVINLVQDYKKGRKACYRCPVACTIQWEVGEGEFAGEKSDKLEFGHYTNMGPLLGLFDFPALVHVSELVNRMGMDCVQFGWNLAMAMECFQRGIIGSEDTDGVNLEWGDEKVISNMIMKVTRREGFGNILAESMPDAVARLGRGAEEYGFHTKGQSFTYNCTQVIAMSLASSVATRGADHLKGHPFPAMIGLQDMLERIFGKNLPEGILEHANPAAKGRVVWWSENYKMLMDSLGICFVPMVGCDVFADPLILFEEMEEIYEAATGRKPDKLFEAAERAYQLEKCFNALQGITRADDLRRGTRRGDEDPIHYPGMLEEYYHYRGCSADGLPTKKRLLEIGLGDAAADLAKMGKLGERECPTITELLGKTS
jgi:aldehyde:ferredoxin oxidoreductase